MVNIKDVDKFQSPEAALYIGDNDGNMLAAMFSRQGDLEEKYHPIEELLTGRKLPGPFGEFGDLDDRAVQLRIKELTFRVIEELCEASNTLRNKPWKQTEVRTDVDHFYEEIADVWHFMIELSLLIGLDARMLYELYMSKAAVNKFRQRSNY